MKRRILMACVCAAPLALGACATQYTGPVEVTRFVAPESTSRLGSGPIFVEGIGGEQSPLALSPYTAAVAQELQRLGYGESARAAAGQIAEVRLERYQIGRGGSRSPVSVGVGGSTGSYGSGVGLGLGINLGGGQRDRIGTQLAVTIRDAATGPVIVGRPRGLPGQRQLTPCQRSGKRPDGRRRPVPGISRQ